MGSSCLDHVNFVGWYELLKVLLQFFLGLLTPFLTWIARKQGSIPPASTQTPSGGCYRVPTGPGNPGKSWKMVGGTGKSWKSVNSSKKVFLKDSEEQPDRTGQQLLKYTKCV